MIILKQIAPHTIYIVGAYFYHAGDIQELSKLEDYLKNCKVSQEAINKALKQIDEESFKIFYGQDWNNLRQEKWWEWACIRQLSYRQGQFLEEINNDPAPANRERFKKLNEDFLKNGYRNNN